MDVQHFTLFYLHSDSMLAKTCNTNLDQANSQETKGKASGKVLFDLLIFASTTL